MTDQSLALSLPSKFQLRFVSGSAGFFSIAAGGYVATGINHINSVDDSGNKTTESFGDANLKKTDYGALASIRYNINLSPGTALFVDGRYTRSLNNLDTSGGSYKYGDFQGLVGLTFGMAGTR